MKGNSNKQFDTTEQQEKVPQNDDQKLDKFWVLLIHVRQSVQKLQI